MKEPYLQRLDPLDLRLATLYHNIGKAYAHHRQWKKAHDAIQKTHYTYQQKEGAGRATIEGLQAELDKIEKKIITKKKQKPIWECLFGRL